MDGTEAHVNFDAPAVLRKWRSLHNERRTEGAGPYLLVDGTLEECIRELMAKPTPLRHLYEIHTAPQPPLVSAVLSGDTSLRSPDCGIFSDPDMPSPSPPGSFAGSPLPSTCGCASILSGLGISKNAHSGNRCARRRAGRLLHHSAGRRHQQNLGPSLREAPLVRLCPEGCLRRGPPLKTNPWRTARIGRS